MPTVMSMHWPKIKQEDYDRALEHVDWEGNTPDGAIFHVAWFDDQDGFHVLDLWESPDQFNRFVEERLMPGLQELGIDAGEPNVRMTEAHRVFTPAFQPA
jgi:hypothetical protein